MRGTLAVTFTRLLMEVGPAGGFTRLYLGPNPEQWLGGCARDREELYKASDVPRRYTNFSRPITMRGVKMTRPIGYGASGAYASSSCHYCGRHATTDDHIVPRAAFAVHQAALPYWFRQHNIAPACRPCNEFKAHFRSDCECEQCSWVWRVAINLFIKDDFEIRTRRVIKVGQSRR